MVGASERKREWRGWRRTGREPGKQLGEQLRGAPRGRGAQQEHGHRLTARRRAAPQCGTPWPLQGRAGTAGNACCWIPGLGRTLAPAAPWRVNPTLGAGWGGQTARASPSTVPHNTEDKGAVPHATARGAEAGPPRGEEHPSRGKRVKAGPPAGSSWRYSPSVRLTTCSSHQGSAARQEWRRANQAGEGAGW